MFGIESDSGILFRSAVHILKHQTTFQVSIIEIDGNDMYDLSHGKNHIANHTMAQQNHMNSVDEFHKLIMGSLRHRKQMATNQNNTSSRSHYFIIVAGQNNNQNLVFANLAGFESAKGKENHDQTRFINSTLSELNGMFSNISKGLVFRGNAKSSFSKFMETFLKQSNDTIIMYHVVNHQFRTGIDYIKDITVSATFRKRTATHPALGNSHTKKNKSISQLS